MRHVLKTSTAIVMVLSLLTPVTTMAQDPSATGAEAVGEAPAPEAPPEAVPLPEAGAEAEASAEPEAETPEAADPAPEQPAEDAPVTGEAPAEKPELVEAPAPEAKPEDAQARVEEAEALAAEAEKQPEPAPRDAVDEQAPDAKPSDADAQADAVAAEVETDMAQEAAPAAEPAETASEPPPEPPVAARDTTPPAEKPAEVETKAPAEKPAEKPASGKKPGTDAEATTDAAETGDALKDALAAEAAASGGKAAETQPETPSDTAAAQDPAAEIANLVENLEAPEAEVGESAAATEAAEAKEAAVNEALKALSGGADQAAASGAQVTQMTVGAEDARRSDEDFVTSVAKSIADAANGENQAKESEAKSGDNKGRDIARLALAGMAGLAVGSMLSKNREVALNTGDRVVVTLPDGSQQLIKNDDTLLFQPGSNVQTENFSDGSSITTVLRADGSKVVTIRDADMNVLRRSVVSADGTQTSLIDDTAESEPVRVSDLPPPARPIVYQSAMSEDALREALMQQSRVDRRFTLDQIRDIAQVRALVPPLDIQSITFETGSAAVQPDQARQLAMLGRAIAQAISERPNEVFLIEGYTDAVGSDASNLALSDRRAESVALALSEYFDVPPENLVVQGYGERFLRIQTDQAERANRRVAIRRITELIAQK